MKKEKKRRGKKKRKKGARGGGGREDRSGEMFITLVSHHHERKKEKRKERGGEGKEGKKLQIEGSKIGSVRSGASAPSISLTDKGGKKGRKKEGRRSVP